MRPGITVVIPTVLNRQDKLIAAIQSAENQTLPPEAIVVVIDKDGEGAAATRTRGLEMVQTEWTAFLDDDDVFYPIHLQTLKMHQETLGADFVFPWFDVVGGSDPFPSNEHREFDVENPHQTTITFLVRTEAALAVGGFVYEPGVDAEDPGTDGQGNRAGEDLRFVIRLARAGYKIGHLHQRTWRWNHWRKPDGSAGNSMGLPSRV